MTLPEAERSFYFAALAQLEPARRPVFTERVTRLSWALTRTPAPVTSTAPSSSPGGLVDAAGNRGIPEAPALVDSV